MKKILTLLTVTVLILSLAACGNNGKKEETPATETGTSAGAPQTEPVDDPDDIASQGAKLIGNWYATDLPLVKLAFSKDGTGTFTNYDGSTLSFNYSQYDYHVFNSGDEYMIKIDYETGESEDIIFWYNEDGSLHFHNSDHGGYTGVMDFSGWQREE